MRIAHVRRQRRLSSLLRRAHRRGQRGASSVEYALIAALIAVVIIASVTFFGSATSNLFRTACTSLPSGTSSASSC
jgi:pilus assembly protein Flp/PilA